MKPNICDFNAFSKLRFALRPPPSGYLTNSTPKDKEWYLFKMKNQLLNDTSKTSKLTLFSFFAMTASMVMTADKYATFASSGFSLAFFLVAGGFLWFIPVSLCAAEMATVEGWEEGGVFTWVGKTIGERFGFAAIFFQWFQITIGFISMIYFILGSHLGI